MSTDTAPPPFLRLAGHPVRWRLLRELSRGDLRVGELSARSRERQSLVSYHLRRLRDGGLVFARRSLADGRDTYYALDLERCGELLDGAARALHPGLARTGGERVARTRVLFLCTGNSARSPMAAGLARALWNVEAMSAGSAPKPLSAGAVQAMAARGVDIGGHRPTHLDELAGREFDHVITLCDRVREVCPEFPGAEAIHWSLRDPNQDGSFEAVAAELELRIRYFLAAVDG